MTMESLLQQDYEDFEIVAVDDGSTDNSFEILQQYETRYPQKVRVLRQENKGISGARNAGIMISRGEYIAFVDADDVWDRTKLRRQVELIDEERDILFVFSDFYRFNHSDMIRYDKTNSDLNSYIYTWPHHECNKERGFIVFEKEQGLELFLKGYPAYPSTLLVQKKLVFKAGLCDPKFPQCQDFDLNLKCSKYSRLCYIDDTLAGIGRHGSNVSSDPMVQALGDLEVLRHHLEGDFFSAAEKERIEHYFGKRLCRVAWNYKNTKDMILSVRYYFQALKYRGSRLHALIRIPPVLSLYLMHKLTGRA